MAACEREKDDARAEYDRLLDRQRELAHQKDEHQHRVNAEKRDCDEAQQRSKKTRRPAGMYHLRDTATRRPVYVI